MSEERELEAGEWTAEKNPGCLLCIYAHFIVSSYGTYPQKVKCDIFGEVDERIDCPKHKLEHIVEVDELG